MGRDSQIPLSDVMLFTPIVEGVPVHQAKGRDAKMGLQSDVNFSVDRAAILNSDRRKQNHRGEILNPLYAEQDASPASMNPDKGLGGLGNQFDLGVHAGADKEKRGFLVEQPLEQSDEFPADAKIAPCSDICDPIAFRKPNRDHKVSEEAPLVATLKLASSPIAPPGDAHGEVAVMALSSSDEASIVCKFDAPAVDVVPSKNGSSICRDEVDHDCWLLVDSQAPLDDTMSSIDVLHSPIADIEDLDLMVPPSDGVNWELAPDSPTDLDHTPSSITPLLSKYSLDVPIFERPSTSSLNDSHVRAQQKPQRKKNLHPANLCDPAAMKVDLSSGRFGAAFAVLLAWG
ncbi:hypothetical protein Nepgr_006676 [Nepenthes gracilis]|uniref:Uncharacterized protein n=1 Tax=Nepenthes gracilis TaxID=150966 RepID=A0AAD3S5Z9_NEPGR|nr:hypothetical protein Nepgr_006676 [Nepenthes gracilis]